MNVIEWSGVKLSVTVNGRPAQIFSHEGRLFLESRVGTQYSIRLENTTWNRLEAVLSVDGLSVLTGKEASVEDRGYILNAQQSYEVKGFREDLSTVAAFKFTEKERSYATEVTGSGTNVGVIGLVVYSEKPQKQPDPIVIEKHIHHDHYIEKPTPMWSTYPQWPWSTTYGSGCTSLSGTVTLNASNSNGAQSDMTTTQCCNYCSTSLGGNAQLDAAPVTFADAFPVEFAHGTTWGSEIVDTVILTEFQRGHRVGELLNLFYNSRENLEKLGIKFKIIKEIAAWPKSFPMSFAKPPHKYKCKWSR